jgi:hypothetical protein
MLDIAIQSITLRVTAMLSVINAKPSPPISEAMFHANHERKTSYLY